MRIVTFISKCLASGFFRKLGSLLCYFTIGLILFAILNSNNIKLPNLFGIGYVNAATNQSLNWTHLQIRSGCVSTGGQSVTLSAITPNAGYQNAWTQINIGSNLQCDSNDKTLQRSYIRIQSNGDMLPSRSYQVTVKQVINCSSFTCVMAPIQNWQYEVGAYNGSSWGDRTTNTSCNSVKLDNQYEYLTTCTFTPKENLKEIVINTYFTLGSISDNSNKIGVRYADYYTCSNATLTYDTNESGAINQQTQVIINQTQQIDNNIQEINDNLNNINDNLNNVDPNASKLVANTFFNGFSSTSENAISSLISIPFIFLNSLVLGSTDDLCFTLRGVTSCLPNGQRTIWSKDFSNHNSLFSGLLNNTTRDTFKTFFNLVVGGFLAYKLITDLIHQIHEWLQPDKDVVEVLKL